MDRKLVGAGTALALVVGGCGSAVKPLSEAQFTQRANAICQRVGAFDQQQLMAAGMAYKQHDRAAGLQALAKVAAREDAGLKELAALVPPKALEASYARYIAVERTVRRLEEQREATPGVNHPRLSKLVHEGIPIRERLGLTACTRF